MTATWLKHRYTLAAAGPGPSGYPPEWEYLGGPGAVTKIMAFRFGQHKQRADFKRWASAYADGRFFKILDREYQKGRRQQQREHRKDKP